MTQLTSGQVWQAVERNLFAVLGMVTSAHQSRTAGVVYIVDGRKLYIGTQKASWKAKHVAANPHLSVTIPIAKQVPLMPWIKIPAATITFAGTGKVLTTSDVPAPVLARLYRDVVKDAQAMATSCVIEVTPLGEFVTYGIGVSLMDMRFPEKARGRAPVA